MANEADETPEDIVENLAELGFHPEDNDPEDDGLDEILKDSPTTPTNYYGGHPGCKVTVHKPKPRQIRRRENENNTDLFSSFEDYGMIFLPSDGKTEDIGIAAVDEWFTYNPNYDIDDANRPRCFIHEDCENLIDSLINYNSNGKMDEALKDFFDLIR